jgi:uncharacterized repeat protein (TIGR03833 family)
MLDCRKKVNITTGIFVEILQKPHQKTGEITTGVVDKVLTKSIHHPYGIKVQLVSGLVGRVQKIIE